MNKPPCWTIYILALGCAGSAVEQLPPSHGASDGENGKRAPRVEGLSQLVQSSSGDRGWAGGAPRGEGGQWEDPILLYLCPCLPPPPSRVFLRLIPTLVVALGTGQ